jgi:hypothetical protein
MSADLAAEKLKDKNVREFDITGKPMKGWVMVEKGSWGKKRFIRFKCTCLKCLSSLKSVKRRP